MSKVDKLSHKSFIRTCVVGRSTGNEASDAGLYAFCTVSVRDNVQGFVSGLTGWGLRSRLHWPRTGV